VRYDFAGRSGDVVVQAAHVARAIVLNARDPARRARARAFTVIPPPVASVLVDPGATGIRTGPKRKTVPLDRNADGGLLPSFTAFVAFGTGPSFDLLTFAPVTALSFSCFVPTLLAGNVAAA
jgi:hypothetical protein